MVLTKNFKLEEFKCKCGCAGHLFHVRELTKLAQNLQKIRDHFARPILVHSGFRCADRNKKVGGVANSLHLQGKAADISIRGIDPALLRNFILSLQNKDGITRGGLGLYPTFVHYDIRGYKVLW